jgi:preprotein translocase subunit SecB
MFLVEANRAVFLPFAMFPKDLDPILALNPNILYPYVRETVSDDRARWFPPVLQPVNLRRCGAQLQHNAQQVAAAAPQPAPAVTH